MIWGKSGRGCRIREEEGEKDVKWRGMTASLSLMKQMSSAKV